MRSTLYFSLGVALSFCLLWPSLSSAATWINGTYLSNCSKSSPANVAALGLSAGAVVTGTVYSGVASVSVSTPYILSCAFNSNASGTALVGRVYRIAHYSTSSAHVQYSTNYDFCTDLISNNGETGVDCGGTCVPCPPVEPETCNNGVKDGDEIGYDCGGSCIAECSLFCPDGSHLETFLDDETACAFTERPLYGNCPKGYSLLKYNTGEDVCVDLLNPDDQPVYAKTQQDADDKTDTQPAQAGWSTGPLSGTTNNTTSGPTETSKDSNTNTVDNANGTKTDTTTIVERTIINETTITKTSTTVVIRDSTTNQPISTETTTVKETETVKDPVVNQDGTKTIVKDTTVQESTIDDNNTSTVKPSTNTTTTTTVDATTEAVLSETAVTSLAPGVDPNGGGTSPTAGVAPGVPLSAVPGPDNTSILKKTTTTTKPGEFGPVTTTTTTETVYDNNTGEVIGENTTTETEIPPEENAKNFDFSPKTYETMDLDTDIVSPDKKSIPGILGDFLLDHPVVAILDTMTVTESDSTCSVAVEDGVYGIPLEISLCRWESTLRALGAVLLVLTQAYGVLIIMGRK